MSCWKHFFGKFGIVHLTELFYAIISPNLKGVCGGGRDQEILGSSGGQWLSRRRTREHPERNQTDNHLSSRRQKNIVFPKWASLSFWARVAFRTCATIIKYFQIFRWKSCNGKSKPRQRKISEKLLFFVERQSIFFEKPNPEKWQSLSDLRCKTYPK